MRSSMALPKIPDCKPQTWFLKRLAVQPCAPHGGSSRAGGVGEATAEEEEGGQRGCGRWERRRLSMDGHPWITMLGWLRVYGRHPTSIHG